jgi:hypothetical protein
VLRGQAESGLEGSGGVGESALGDLDVAQREGASQRVGDVTGGDQGTDRFDVEALGRAKVAGGPVGEGQKRRCAAAAEVVSGLD